MERLKLWLIPLYCLAGFLVVVLILPASRWVVLRQVDVLAGRWRLNVVQSINFNQPQVTPVERGLTKDDLDSDPTAQFLYLTGDASRHPEQMDARGRTDALFAICKRQHDVRYWAQLIRNFSMEAMIPLKQTGPGSWVPFNDPLNRSRLGEACVEASKLDPNNAYFQVILAGTLYRNGAKAAAETTLIRAADLSNFDDYGFFDAELRNKYLIDTYGYRGDQARALIFAETPLPELGTISHIGQFFAHSNNPKVRYAVARLGDLMMRKSATTIGIYIGGKVMDHALGPTRLDSNIPLSPQEADRSAKFLQEQVHSTAVLRPGIDLSEQVQKKLDNLEPTAEAARTLYNLQPAYSASSLLLLLLAPFALAFAWLKSNSPRFGYAAPHLAWLIGFATEPAFFHSGLATTSATIFGLASLLFIPAMFEKTRKFVEILGVGIGIMALVLGLFSNDLFLLPPAQLFLSCILVQRLVKRVPTMLTAGYVILACGVSAAYWMPTLLHLHLPDAIVFGGMAAIGAFAAIPVREPLNWRPVVGISAAVFGLGFATMVYKDISTNKQMAAVCETILHDGDRLRAAVSEK